MYFFMLFVFTYVPPPRPTLVKVASSIASINSTHNPVILDNKLTWAIRAIAMSLLRQYSHLRLYRIY